MGAILQLLIPAIPGIVNLVENLFAKPKSGTDKMNAALQMLQVLLSQLGTAGLLPADAAKPNADALQAAIETVLAQLKATGKLGAVQDGALFLLQGTVTPLVAAAK